MTNDPTWKRMGRSAPPALSNWASSAGCISCVGGTVVALNPRAASFEDCAPVCGTIASPATIRKRRIFTEKHKRIDNPAGNRSFYSQVRSPAVIDDNRDGHFREGSNSL